MLSIARVPTRNLGECLRPGASRFKISTDEAMRMSRSIGSSTAKNERAVLPNQRDNRYNGLANENVSLASATDAPLDSSLQRVISDRIGLAVRFQFYRL